LIVLKQLLSSFEVMDSLFHHLKKVEYVSEKI